MTQYYNTTNAEGRTLKDYQNATLRQDDRIYLFFKQNDNARLCPSQVMNMVFKGNTPLTSVRRSLNTLTKQGLLIKTDILRRGQYGRLVHCWKVAK